MKFHQYSPNCVEVMAKKPFGGLIQPPHRLDRVDPIPPGLFWSSCAWGGGGGVGGGGPFKSPPSINLKVLT